MHLIVDRRPNKGRSGPNRQLFHKRAREQIQQAVSETVAKRRVSDPTKTTDQILVKGGGTEEPRLYHGVGGDRDMILPGNKVFVRGDRLKKPKADGVGGGSGSGTGEGGGGGDGGFEWYLSAEEYLNYYFESMELPDFVKASLAVETAAVPRRAGYRTSGTPASMDMTATMEQSFGRAAALGRPKPAVITALREALIAAIEGGGEQEVLVAREALEAALQKSALVPFIDTKDLRYRRFEPRKKTINRAVMFCLMDVSGSMSEHMKDLAKRFFLLLRVFLERKYTQIEVRFIRHTETAEEVDENIFFHDPKTGGTVVSSALSRFSEVQKRDFPANSWNIYLAQASDGDNTRADNVNVVKLMNDSILPVVQYMAYIETHNDINLSMGTTDLWGTYLTLGSEGAARKLAMRQVAKKTDIWPVFAELFAKVA
jgi:uncharacterized sporulation protein YeaH/YhbH (DUF444 family)